MAEKNNEQNIYRKLNHVCLFLLVIIVIIGAYLLEKKSNNDINNTETVPEEGTTTSTVFFRENEQLTPYLDMLGLDIVDGNLNASPEFIANMSSVEIMNVMGAIEHKYTINDNAPMFIDSMIWRTNETHTEKEFQEFVCAMDSYFGFFATRDKNINKSNETYIWLDFLRSCRVLGWYADGIINLEWILDEDIPGLPNEPITSKYLSIIPDLLSEDLCRFLVYLDLSYAETGFTVAHSSNTMNTRYPVGECLFYGENSYVYVWYDEETIERESGVPKYIEIHTLCDYETLKDYIYDSIGHTTNADDSYGFKIDIPNTDLMISVHKEYNSLADIFIGRIDNMQSSEKKNDELPQNIPETPTSSYSGSNARHTDSEAFSCAKDIVKRSLKSPSTAEFCWITDATIAHLGDGQYMVTGWVDAQNGFGAMIRQEFVVTYTATEHGYKNGEVMFS